MKQTLRRLSLWSVCLLALGATPTWAQQAHQAGGSVFIQGSEVNLREKPATTAKVVGKVAIATECQHVKAAPKQWVRIRCGDVEGFTLKSLVGAEKPTVEPLLAQAQDASLDARARLDAAVRAATLAPENEQALKLLSERFFDASFEQLQKDQLKGGLREASLVMRRVLQDVPVVKRESGPEGVTRELEKIEYDWHRIEFRGNAFVSAMYRGGALAVYAGAFSSATSLYKLELEDRDEEFRVVIQSRSSTPVSEVLQRALRQGARTPTPDEEKYSATHQESPDMPALSGESLRHYLSLPSRWYTLSESDSGEYILDTSCGLWGVDLRMDLHRRASIWWRRFQGGGEATESVIRVVGVSKTPGGYQLQLRYRSGFQKTLTLSWPTSVANMARWDLGPPNETKYYAVANSRNVRVVNTGCRLE
ncbi:hypothetical protein HPC49_12510 [Pyxidicoccus fallax]|uniref:SH3b domain-containing protein n=1 Tax=Pyxidicoccus fallax TaxID=394095 RepID=A0A848LP29_9BACT|nr:hypothetical protein [Pyxidicoccus fallax]NMO19618.1 hypothetical protein [Pyxidicoccus fallax]NPC79057.1 hypothetical protein [Pyxidicoccus fallax]